MRALSGCVEAAHKVPTKTMDEVTRVAAQCVMPFVMDGHERVVMSGELKLALKRHRTRKVMQRLRALKKGEAFEGGGGI